MTIFPRTDTSRLAEWWFTIDRTMLALLLALAAAGCLVGLATSPAIAMKRGMDAFNLAGRQLVITLVAVAVMIALSLLSPREARRFSLALLLAALLGLALVLVVGPEIKGSRRWLRLAGLSLQPSEFVKPAFAVISAWLFSEATRRIDIPAFKIAVALYLLVAALLLAEPDVGQTLLVTITFGALLVVSGRPLKGAAMFAGLAAAGFAVAYLTLPHVQARLSRYLGGAGDTFQTDKAAQSFLEGGFLGRGPGEGVVKLTLPDAHTDFAFAVIAEEFGIIACLALLGLLATIVMRALIVGLDHRDRTTRLTIAALSLLFAAQALINMGVAVGLLPAKGMTLPFISQGGSSTVAIGITTGLLLAFLRRDPSTARPNHATFTPAIEHIRHRTRRPRTPAWLRRQRSAARQDTPA